MRPDEISTSVITHNADGCIILLVPVFVLEELRDADDKVSSRRLTLLLYEK